jgi:hypothetical protein
LKKLTTYIVENQTLVSDAGVIVLLKKTKFKLPPSGKKNEEILSCEVRS